MKKLFYALSLALIGGVAANAAGPVPTRSLLNQPVKINSASQTASMKAVRVESTKQGRQVRKGLPSSADAYFGNWQWVGENMLSAVVMPNEGVLSIEPIAGSDSILIKGFSYIADQYTVRGGLTGYFKNGRIYIPSQPTSYDADPFQGDEPTAFYCWTLRGMTPEEKEKYEAEHGPGSADGIGYITEAPAGTDFFLALATDTDGVEYLTSIYYEDPDAPHDDAVLAQSWAACSDEPTSRAGYWWFVCRVQGLYLEPFEFNPAEWTPAGTAQFKDAWLAPLFEDDIPAYDVPLYRSTLNENRFLLLDPYGPDTPFGELNESGDEGYLVFDTAEPECVLFEPFVYSMASDLFGEGQIQSYYFYNAEGYYFFVQGTPVDDIIGTFLDRERDLTYLDSGPRKVYIYNGMFDMGPEYTFATGLSWVDVEMSGYVALPAGYDAVESIIGDNQDAPAIYYNLQGVRVNNPEKGQLIIVRKGNQTTKQIVR